MGGACPQPRRCFPRPSRTARGPGAALLTAASAQRGRGRGRGSPPPAPGSARSPRGSPSPLAGPGAAAGGRAGGAARPRPARPGVAGRGPAAAISGGAVRAGPGPVSRGARHLVAVLSTAGDGVWGFMLYYFFFLCLFLYALPSPFKSAFSPRSSLRACRGAAVPLLAWACGLGVLRGCCSLHGFFFPFIYFALCFSFTAT